MDSKWLGLTLVVLLLCSLLCSLQALEVPEVVKKQVKKVHARCVNQTGVSEAMIVETHKTQQLPNDPTFKCFLHCMFDMFGLIDSEQVMHLESLIEVLPETMHEKVKRLADTCGTQKGVDACDTVYQSIKCYMDTDGPFIRSSVDQLLG
ncbi:Pbprp1 [Drosophila busckii]|uniref:Pbprp1 n=1 Tax=Drosophila busckii TaxID=30019 RepID=A0A0M3QWK8_DROBS|nr:general odorant-binding protein 69a [Drosophila busckii]ALC44323.1 Pbprp1 [Drosophila busckii]